MMHINQEAASEEQKSTFRGTGSVVDSQSQKIEQFEKLIEELQDKI